MPKLCSLRLPFKFFLQVIRDLFIQGGAAYWQKSRKGSISLPEGAVVNVEFCLFRSSGFLSQASTVAMLNPRDFFFFSNLRALHFIRLQYAAASGGRRPTLAAVYVTVSENNAAAPAAVWLLHRPPHYAQRGESILDSLVPW